MSFMTNTTPTAAKVHRCTWCDQPIERGEKHHMSSGVDEVYSDGFFRWRAHMDCLPRIQESANLDAENSSCLEVHDRGAKCECWE